MEDHCAVLFLRSQLVGYHAGCSPECLSPHFFWVYCFYVCRISCLTVLCLMQAVYSILLSNKGLTAEQPTINAATYDPT